MKRPPVPPQASAPSLAERIELLSAKRQEIIRPILEHPRDYVLLSVRAMAKRLKTDPATVVRIVRGLGFASYRDFQRHLHDLSSPLPHLSTPCNPRARSPACPLMFATPSNKTSRICTG
jgi:DNA-binding MurR/RpiR family transcriptional regulator